MIYGIELMRLLKEAKMELDVYRAKNGDVLVLSESGNSWMVALYSRADIEQWSVTFRSLDEAQATFDRWKREDKQAIDKSGAKK